MGALLQAGSDLRCHKNVLTLGIAVGFRVVMWTSAASVVGLATHARLR